MFWKYNALLITLFLVPQTYCIDVLRFDDPKDDTNEDFKIGNISDDNYEILLNITHVPFPIGQDFAICFRCFFDQIRFDSPGGISFHLQLYMNASDQII